jgi:hypothetical protein
MSEPKRYSNLEVWKALHFGENTSGWVKYEDYALLKAEVERLRRVSINNIVVGYETAKAEVERLTKAGDNLVYVVTEHPVAEPFVKAWFAAKEGKQP